MMSTDATEAGFTPPLNTLNLHSVSHLILMCIFVGFFITFYAFDSLYKNHAFQPGLQSLG